MPDRFHPAGRSQQKHIRPAQGKQTVGHHAHDVVQLRFQLDRLGNLQVVDVEDDVAVVGDKTVAVHRIAAQFHDLPRHMAAGHGNHFHRQRKTAQYRHLLGSIGNADKFLRHGGDDFFPRQCAATALDQAQVGIGFIGAIHIYGNLVHRIQVEYRNSVLLQTFAGGFGTGHRAFDQVLHFRQFVDEKVGGGAGAHADDGAFFHMGNGGFGNGLFQFILGHGRDSGIRAGSAHYKGQIGVC